MAPCGRPPYALAGFASGSGAAGVGERLRGPALHQQDDPAHTHCEDGEHGERRLQTARHGTQARDDERCHELPEEQREVPPAGALAALGAGQPVDRFVEGMPLPIDFHLGTIDVLADGDGSRVVYSQEILPEDLAPIVERAVRDGIASIARYFAGHP